ncbi:uncharacterized protein LOC111624311 [Centruroides sculpturatus]|nr:uncharacterized protein LOC111624311 [Centruroides sculpturatus]
MLQCWTIIIDNVVQIIAVSMIAYVAAALMLVGSVTMVNRYSPMNRILRNAKENTNLDIDLSVAIHNSSSTPMKIDVEVNMDKIETIIIGEQSIVDNNSWKQVSVYKPHHNACNHNFPFVRTIAYKPLNRIHTFPSQNRQLKQPG